MPALKKYSLWRLVYGLLYIVGPIVLLGLRLHWRIQKQARVRVLIYNQSGEVLLVKGAVGSRQWSLPGGGVERGETEQQAAVRELKEELGLVVAKQQLEYLLTVQPGPAYPRLRYEAPLYALAVDKTAVSLHRYRKIELQAVQWVARDALPAATSSLVITAVKQLPLAAKLVKMD